MSDGVSMRNGPLHGVRICDLSGQLAGAGATRTLAAFGASVIRVEDPVTLGTWDILRGVFPYIDRRRGIESGGAFNNHNVEKLGITLNLRTERGKQLLSDLIANSDVVTENFSAGVLESWGFSYEEMLRIKPDLIYVSNCGFGHGGPYREFRTWGPIVQALCGLTFTCGLPDRESAGWGFSYMDHQGANFMTLAVMAALHHRRRTGEGQWVDMATVETGMALTGPAILDWSVNGRPSRRAGMPDSNRQTNVPMAPHEVFRCAGDDNWVAIACRDDTDWSTIASVIGTAWARDPRWSNLEARIASRDELERLVGTWTIGLDKFEVQARLLAAGVPAAAAQKPPERIEHDEGTSAWGLWPSVEHAFMGSVRVDGLPVHLSDTDWGMTHGAPLLGQHNHEVLGGLLGLDDDEVAQLEHDHVI